MKSAKNNLFLKLVLPTVLLIPFYFVVPTVFMLGMFGVGLFIGILIMLADEKWLYQLYKEPNSDLEPAQQTFQPKLITRSVLFILTLIPLSLFVVTSTDVVIGWGVILSIWLTLLIEMWRLRNFPDQYHDWFLFDLKRSVSLEEIGYMVYGLTALFFVWVLLLVM